jgi:MFS family permease
VLVRMLASSFAQAEFVVSTTIVNEEIPARRRGMLYAIVQTGMLLLVFAGIGVLFYLLGGLLGERWGRRQVLIGTALLVPPLNLLFLLAHEHAVLVVVYFLIYQSPTALGRATAMPIRRKASRPGCAAPQWASSARCSPPGSCSGPRCGPCSCP